MPGTHVGRKCQVQIPISRIAPVSTPLLLAQQVLEAKCQAVGCTAGDITLVSRRPWTDDTGPRPDIDLLTYETTATPQ